MQLQNDQHGMSSKGAVVCGWRPLGGKNNTKCPFTVCDKTGKHTVSYLDICGGTISTKAPFFSPLVWTLIIVVP